MRSRPVTEADILRRPAPGGLTPVGKRPSRAEPDEMPISCQRLSLFHPPKVEEFGSSSSPPTSILSNVKPWPHTTRSLPTHGCSPSCPSTSSARQITGARVWCAPFSPRLPEQQAEAGPPAGGAEHAQAGSDGPLPQRPLPRLQEHRRQPRLPKDHLFAARLHSPSAR